MLYSGRKIDNDQWSYSGRPAESTTDEVRFLVGDTNTDEKLLTDGEVAYAIAETSTTMRAAAMLADSLAAYFSREVDRQIDDVQRISLSQRAESYRKRAVELRDQSNARAALLGAPYAGGISQSDKDSRDDDTNQIKSPFRYSVVNTSEALS